jgi:hypothetical protein
MNGSNDKLIDELANLLNETAEAHHKTFAATEGIDPAWPTWYADYFLEKMRHMSVATGAYWPRFYAKCFVKRYL